MFHFLVNAPSGTYFPRSCCVPSALPASEAASRPAKPGGGSGSIVWPSASPRRPQATPEAQALPRRRPNSAAALRLGPSPTGSRETRSLGRPRGTTPDPAPVTRFLQGPTGPRPGEMKRSEEMTEATDARSWFRVPVPRAAEPVEQLPPCAGRCHGASGRSGEHCRDRGPEAARPRSARDTTQRAHRLRGRAAPPADGGAEDKALGVRGVGQGCPLPVSGAGLTLTEGTQLAG